MANIRLVALLSVLVFLSFPPTLPSQGLRAKASGQTLSKFFNKFSRYLQVFNNLANLYKFILDQGESSKPKDTPPTSNTEAEQIGFYLTFYIGNPQRPITAQMSISSAITTLDNYQPSYSSTYQCCTANLSCSTTNCNRDYYVLADTFTFQNGHLSNVPYVYNTGNKQLNSTGFLSFSRSPYSLLRTSQEEVLSYYFSDSNSSCTIGGVPNTTALQSTKILTNPSYPYLYYVSLTKISIGNSSFEIDPTTNSSSVILDTVIMATLLETALYAKVKAELMKIGNSFSDTASGLEVCYSNKPHWPNLTLFFPSYPPSSSARAQMVLTRNSYIVTVESGAECAAIVETEGASVIGIMAQINRKMIFNISSSEPKVYFSQFPSSAFSVVLSEAMLIMILIWSLSVLLYL